MWPFLVAAGGIIGLYIALEHSPVYGLFIVICVLVYDVERRHSRRMDALFKRQRDLETKLGLDDIE